jgi:hypothetical protein
MGMTNNGGSPLHLTMRAIAIVVVLALAPTACGDDTDSTAAGDEPSDLCDEVRRVLHSPVGTPTDEVDAEEAIIILRRIADRADGPITSDIRSVADFVERFEHEPETLDSADSDRAWSTITGVVTWALDTCPPDEPTWGCAVQDAFTPVGGAIAPFDEGHDTPEAAADRGADDDLLRVEVERADLLAPTVLFAYLDERGLAARSVEVVYLNDEWTVAATRVCR